MRTAANCSGWDEASIGVESERTCEEYREREFNLSTFLSNSLSISMCCASTRAQWSGNVEALIRVESERTCEEYITREGYISALFYQIIYLYLCVA